MSLTATLRSSLSPRRHWRQQYEARFASLAPPPRGSLTGRFQVLREAPSRVDGRPGVQVEYPPESAAHWRLFVDELRWLELSQLYAVPWLPADLPIVRALEARLS